MSAERPMIAIGDIHGCVRSAEALLNTLIAKGWADERQTIFVGDYIDRGPDSKGVVDLVLDYGKQYDTVTLRGNHEQMMLDAHQTGNTSLWLSNGGSATLKSYDAPYNKLELPSNHFHFYRNTKFYHQTEDYVFVHAGLPPDMTVAEALADESVYEDFLWQRSHLHLPEVPWEKTVVFGHTPQAEPLIKSQRIGIDTGCVYKHLSGMGKLTAVLLPEREFVFQECVDEPQPY
ncbi:MAG: metallophosphoesterase family protein [Bacteroidota bacterium]